MSVTTYGGMTFSEKLKKLMADRRLSQDALAQLLDVSQNLVSLWARGKNAPDIHQAAMIGRVLGGIDLNYLVDDTIEEPPGGPKELPRDQQAVLDLYIALGLSQREALKRLATPVVAASGEEDADQTKSG